MKLPKMRLDLVATLLARARMRMVKEKTMDLAMTGLTAFLMLATSLCLAVLTILLVLRTAFHLMVLVVMTMAALLTAELVPGSEVDLPKG